MTQEPNAGVGSEIPVGNGNRKVQKGECVFSIASEVGHFWETIWNDPGNQKIKAIRGAPHVLLEGDQLHVPPIRPKEESAATDETHRYRRKGIPIYFELVVKDDDVPLAGGRYVLNIEGKFFEGTISSDGLIKVPIEPNTYKGNLRVFVNSIEREYPLIFGALDPPHTLTGAIGRLQNMGYIDSDDKAELQNALKKFQNDYSLIGSGELNEVTAVKLVEIHGS